MVGSHDPFERRLNDLARRGRDHEKGKLTAIDATLEELDERGNVAAKPDAAARFLKMLASNPPEFRVVPDEICELAPLLHQVAASQPIDLLLKLTRPNQLAEDETGIVETERLIEIRRDQEMPGHRTDRHDASPPPILLI